MSAIKITDKIYSVGVINPNLRIFDIVMATKFGTSYNSYIIKGEQNILIETCHDEFFEEYIANIEQVVPTESIKYIVLNHTEPDHSGVLARLMVLCPHAQIICSRSASMFLKQITNIKNLNFKIATDNEQIQIGETTLQFIIAPFLHWPDSMFTYFKDEDVLFTCDFLGSHYCVPTMMDKDIYNKKAYWEEFENYYNAIFSPFKPYVLAGIEKLKEISPSVVCPSHGPVLTKAVTLSETIERYSANSMLTKNNKTTVPIFYCTAYGNTKKAAQAIATGIINKIPDGEVALYDLNETEDSIKNALVNTCDAFLLGSPTINKDAVTPAWELLAHIDPINFSGKPCSVFGSFGWSGEAIPNLSDRLKGLRGKLFDNPYKFQFVPSDEDIKNLTAYGENFAVFLMSNKK